VKWYKLFLIDFLQCSTIDNKNCAVNLLLIAAKRGKLGFSPSHYSNDSIILGSKEDFGGAATLRDFCYTVMTKNHLFNKNTFSKYRNHFFVGQKGHISDIFVQTTDIVLVLYKWALSVILYIKTAF
jgi:hypothetical protein